MKFVKNIEEDIYSQIEAGFTKTEIRQNLLLKGTPEAEIDEAFSKINFEQVAATNSSNQGVSIKSILIGLLFVVVLIVRIGRLANNGANIFSVISIIALIVVAIFYFTKRR